MAVYILLSVGMTYFTAIYTSGEAHCLCAGPLLMAEKEDLAYDIDPAHELQRPIPTVCATP